MLNGSDLTVTQVAAVARHGAAVQLAPEAIKAMGQARDVVQEVLATNPPVYGLTTGAGERKSVLLTGAERRRSNHRPVLNHRIAQGDDAPADVVRGAAIRLDRPLEAAVAAKSAGLRAAEIRIDRTFPGTSLQALRAIRAAAARYARPAWPGA
jgi:histidine ammonia-lyase